MQDKMCKLKNPSGAGLAGIPSFLAGMLFS